MDWSIIEEPRKVYPDNGVAKDLTSLLQNKAFDNTKDFTIKVQHKEFKVHKMVIISASHYFNALLEYADVEGKELKEAELDGLNPLAVSNLIDYIYSNEVMGTRADPADLLEAASFLQIPTAVTMAAKFMKETVDKENCLNYLHIFELYSLTAEAMYTRDFIQDNFEDIFRACPLNTKSYEDLLELVQLWGNTEWQLFEVIKQWCNFDKDTRAQHLDSLMYEVRFELLTLDELKTIKALQIFKKSDRPWTSLVDRAIDYHDFPAHQKVISPHNKIRQQPTPVVFSALESNKNKAYALQKDGKWRKFVTDDSPDLHKGVAASVVVNNFLIVCQAYSPSQAWHLFDPRTHTWSTMSKMKYRRKDFALSHDGRYLYSMGGYVKQPINAKSRLRILQETDSMIKYDFESDSWSDMSTKLPVACHNQYACHLSGFIYMTGGFPGNGQCTRRLDRFNPRKEIWEPRAPMLEKRPCFAMNVLTLQGEDFIHVMNDHFIMQYYNPRSDQWSLWSSFSDMKSDLIADINHIDREDMCVLGHKDTVFLLNVDRDSEYHCEDDHVLCRFEPAGCVTWSIRRDSRHVTQRYLNNFPLFVDGLHEEHCDAKYTAGFLAFPRALPAQ